jgi:drug/metabolite transporter (DMT)-like permease
MALMALAVMTIPVMDSIAKWLSGAMAFTAVALARFVFQSLFLLPLALHLCRGRPSFHRTYVSLGALIAATILFLFWGLSHLPLANNVAIFFVEPLFLMLLAGWFLGERIAWQQWAAVLVGLVGALVIIRPNWGEYGATSLLPLAAAVCFAGYLAVTRAFTRRCQGEDAVVMQFWIGLTATAILGIFFLLGPLLNWQAFIWRPPTPVQSAWLMAAGALGGLGHVLISMAFRRAPASTLAPFQYLEILGASLLGWWLFDEIPDRYTILGALIIVAAGLYIFQHQRRMAADSVAMLG